MDTKKQLQFFKLNFTQIEKAPQLCGVFFLKKVAALRQLFFFVLPNGKIPLIAMINGIFTIQ